MKRYFKVLKTLLWKEMKWEMRRREMLPGMLAFSLMLMILFHYSMPPQETWHATVPAGIFWVTVAFASILGLNRSLALEQDQGLRDSQVLTVVDHSVFYVSKVISNWISLLFLSLILMPVIRLLYQTGVFSLNVVWVILLGTLGLAAAGSLLAGLALPSRMRDTLLTILLFPLWLPLLLASVKVTSGLWMQLSGGEISPWINLMLVYDFIFFTLGWMTAPAILED